MPNQITAKQAIAQRYQQEGPQLIEEYEEEVTRRVYCTGDAFSATIIAIVELNYVMDKQGHWQPPSQ